MPNAFQHTEPATNTAVRAAASLSHDNELQPIPDQKRDTQSIFKVQPKLTVGAPDDPFEKEADAVADTIMRMPDNEAMAQPYSVSNEHIQREDDEETTTATPTTDKETLQQQPPEPDFLSLKTPFFERNVSHLWDPQSALGVWKYNLDYFKRFGLDDSWAGKAANLTAPFFINSQLKASNPTWWEITDKELNTTSIVGSLPLFSFDPDFKNWKPLPFLQKKSLDSEPPVTNAVPGNFLQRKCADCEREEKLQRKSIFKNITPFIQAKAAESGTGVSDSISHQLQSSRGGGSTMERHTQSFMESRFNADFSGVRIHADRSAATLSNDLNAKAFTVGNDIYFNEGKYHPESPAGKHLLAHELTHTIQQGGIQKKLSVQKQEAVPQIPTTAQPAPAPPGSDIMAILEAQSAIDNYNIQLRDAVLAPISGPRADGISFLNRIRSVTPAQADILTADEEFLNRVRAILPGRNLWTVFTLLHFHNRIQEPHLRLKLAVLQRDARLLADMLSLTILSYHVDQYYTILREVVNFEFAGDPLLNELLRLIDHRNDPGISQRETGSYREAHYEQNAAGAYAITSFTGNVSANSYFSGNELRVIVKMLFLDGNDVASCPNTSAAGCQPFYFLGTYSDEYTTWLNTIRQVWNGRFNISNGTNSFDIVFVPMFLSEPDPEATRIRAMTNATLRCDTTLQPGRSEQTCWFMNVPPSVVAHEFGHIIGASDEYNLPGSNQEIINAGITGMSAQDMTLSSMEGVTGSPQAPNPNRRANTTNTLMGSSHTSTTVNTRHLTRLMTMLNAGLAPGIPPFTISAGRRRR
jgi:hypothetical protein